MASYIEEKTIWNDIKKITSNTTTPSEITNFIGILHTTTDDMRITKIISLDIARDYVNKIGDEIVIKFLLPYGDYINLFYPKRHNLELTVITSRHSSVGTTDSITDKASSERYKAIFIDSANINDSLKFSSTIDNFTLNNREPAEVTLQLINRTLEPLRIKTTQGIFNDVNREDLIRAILGGETYKVKIDGKPGLDALDIYKLDNRDQIKQIILPHNLLITALPSYLQEKHTGLYNAGVGNYFQRYNKKRTWFVYPLFDFTRIDADTGKKALIYGSSSIRFTGMRTTYMEEADTLLILTSGEQRYTDDGESSQMNNGVGFRQANADLIMSKPVQMSEDGPIGIKKSLITEVALKKREDNLNFAPVSSRAISNNNIAEYSRHLINNGARIDLVWNNSNSDLIYPGMPCKYIYSEGETTKEIKGVILNAHTMITTGNRSGIKMTDTSYTSVTMLTLFVEKFYQPNAFKSSNFTGTAVVNTAPVYVPSTSSPSTSNYTGGSSSGTSSGGTRDVTAIFGPVLNQGMYYTSDGSLATMNSVIDLGDGRLKATDVWGNTYFIQISTMLQYRPSYVPLNSSGSTSTSTGTSGTTTSTVTTPSTFIGTTISSTTTSSSSSSYLYVNNRATADQYNAAWTATNLNPATKIKIQLRKGSSGNQVYTLNKVVPRSVLDSIHNPGPDYYIWSITIGADSSTVFMSAAWSDGYSTSLPLDIFDKYVTWEILEQNH